MNEVETVHFFFNKRKISLQELKNEFCKYFNSLLQCWYSYFYHCVQICSKLKCSLCCWKAWTHSGLFLKYQLLLQTNILVKHFFYLNKLNYEKHIQTSNLTIYYDNKDLYVYYIGNIYTKLQTNEGWNSNRNFRCGRNTR